jgi:hypothetical protein
MKTVILVVGFYLYAQVGFSQRVEIDRIFFENGKVHVQYKLIDDKGDRNYQMQLYGSIDNYISPLKEVRGAVGVEIYPGEQKEIIWDPFAEYGEDFEDQIALEIRGRVYIPFVKFDDFNFKSIKRGKAYALTWTGGSASNILNIELYNSENNKVEVFSNVANVGEYSLTLPKGTKPGKGYRLRISDKKNKDDVVYSKEFKVVRKIPLVAQIGAGVIIAGGIYYFVSQLGAEENNSIESVPTTPE